MHNGISSPTSWVSSASGELDNYLTRTNNGKHEVLFSEAGSALKSIFFHTWE